MHSRKPSDDADKPKKARKPRGKKGETTPTKKSAHDSAPTVAGDAYDRLVRVATARMEALSQPDAYGTRPTAAGLHRTVSRWAAEGPVAARRAA